MKRFFVFAAEVLLFTSSVFAMDSAKLNRYLTELTPQMSIGAEQVQSAITSEEHRQAAIKPTTVDTLKLAILYHNGSQYLFSKGVKGYAEKGEKLILPLYENDSIDEELRPIIITYLGSLKALEANESFNPIEKIMGVNKGFKYLNEAVDKYGKTCYLPCWVRSNVAMAVPDFFNKEKVAFEDLSFLDQRFQSDASFATKDLMAAVYLNFGNYYKKQKNIPQAIKYWTLSKKLDSNGQHGGAAAQDMLEVFED